jgi:hypothetical protein
MRRSIPVLFAFLLSILFFQAPSVTYAANCQYVLGFKILHDKLPTTIGDCLVDEHHNPANGDALQETSKGLLVWRKSDNFTAFTDGYRTWVNGPFGIQQRLNTERFPWETAVPAPVPLRSDSGCMLTDKDVKIGQYVRDPNGSVSSQFTVKNPCSSSIDVMVDATAFATQGGAPLIDAPTVDVIRLPVGQSQTLVTHLPPSSNAGWFASRYHWFREADMSVVCLNVKASKCLNTDGWLISTVDDLNQLAEGQTLLQTAADHGVTLARGKTDYGVLGFYDPSRRLITLDTRLDANSSWVRATVLAHELTHASDDVLGLVDQSSAGCYQEEERAFTTEAGVWNHLWQGKLPPSVDSIHGELNDITMAVFNDPKGFVQALIDAYQSECGS